MIIVININSVVCDVAVHSGSALDLQSNDCEFKPAALIPLVYCLCVSSYVVKLYDLVTACGGKITLINIIIIIIITPQPFFVSFPQMLQDHSLQKLV